MIIRLITIIYLFSVLPASSGQDQCTAEDNIGYGFCPGSEEPLYLACISVEPYPVLFEPHEIINISAHVDLWENVTEGSRVKVRITREDGSTPVYIPCINTNEWGAIGSCDYEGNDFLQYFSSFFCPDLDSPENCTLPLYNQTYGRSEPYEVTLPEFEEDIDFLLSGTFHIELTVVREDGTEHFCVYFTVELQQTTTTPTQAPDTTMGQETCQQCLEEAGMATFK